MKPALTIVLLMFLLTSFTATNLFCQDRSGEIDTFFLSKKKGILGKLGRSISTEVAQTTPIQLANPYIIYAGKTIRNIHILSLGFERNINDTTYFRNSFGAIIANAFHKNTKTKIIENNLFFRKGSTLHPYLLADNERHLREQTYIQDARIFVVNVPGSTAMVDVIVITKDVFSIGGNFSLSGTKRAKVGIREENAGGSGSKVSVSTFYEKDRRPNFGYGAEVIKRNIKGSFIDLKLGFQNYKSAFNSGRSEETYLYAQFEKPLVSPYMPWVGSLEMSVNKTSNAYIKDSVYQSDYRYKYFNTDAWFGYNFGRRRLMSQNKADRLRKLIAVRAFHVQFDQLPYRNQFAYDYRYANVSGMLMAFNVFKQNFYRTNFIYGFGRNEDVPEGFSASLIGGYTVKDQKTRAYYGVDLLHSNFNKKGMFSSYTFRLGGYSYKNRMEDIDILLNVEHFTRLKRMGSKWLNRNFYNIGFTRQLNTQLNPPLLLRSAFGIPYHWNGTIDADFRGTLRGETVFINLNKILGFRLAPFLFGDLCGITPSNKSFKKTELYSAWGAGIRTRNENLVFGTIELRSYYFPRPVDGMRGFKVEVSTNIRFKYNSTFVRKPDFVVPN